MDSAKSTQRPSKHATLRIAILVVVLTSALIIATEAGIPERLSNLEATLEGTEIILYRVDKPNKGQSTAKNACRHEIYTNSYLRRSNFKETSNQAGQIFCRSQWNEHYEYLLPRWQPWIYILKDSFTIDRCSSNWIEFSRRTCSSRALKMMVLRVRGNSCLLPGELAAQLSSESSNATLNDDLSSSRGNEMPVTSESLEWHKCLRIGDLTWTRFISIRRSANHYRYCGLSCAKSYSIKEKALYSNTGIRFKNDKASAGDVCTLRGRENVRLPVTQHMCLV